MLAGKRAATLLACCCLTFAGCALPSTKRWHLGTRDTETSVGYMPHTGVYTIVLRPPRGPNVEYSEIRKIKVGDPGERIYSITKPHYPHYFKQGALVRTDINGKVFEVGFLLKGDKTGIITDISFWPLDQLPDQPQQ